MTYHSDPRCSKPQVRSLQKAHDFLCQNSSLYRKWHCIPIHKHIHFGILSVVLLLIFSMIIDSVALPFERAMAISNTWNLDTASDYSYDNTKITISNGVAELKTSGAPGVDWIATSSGNDWDYRKTITIDNSAGLSDLTNYQAKLTLDTATLVTAGKMQADLDDIRFTNSDKISTLSYYIESGANTASTVIWIGAPNVTANQTKDIYIYYGNIFYYPQKYAENMQEIG